MSGIRRVRPGFTIVELLIVIVVIAILAAISIVAYSGIQNRAKASQASSALSQAKKKLELYKVDNSNYPTTGNLATAGISDSDVVYQYTSDGATYCLTATAGNVSYKISNTTSPAQGGCAGHGQGGVAAITNLILNPSLETNLTNVTSVSSASLTRETNVSATSGSYVVRVVTPGAVSNEGLAASLGATPFGTYTGSVYIWGSGTVRMWFRFGYTDATYTEGTYGGPFTLSGTPQRITTSSTFTDNGKTPSYLHLYIRTNTAQAVTFYVDSLMANSGSLASYADGNSTDWVWNGTPNNSTSTGPSL